MLRQSGFSNGGYNHDVFKGGDTHHIALRIHFKMNFHLHEVILVLILTDARVSSGELLVRGSIYATPCGEHDFKDDLLNTLMYSKSVRSYLDCLTYCNREQRCVSVVYMDGNVEEDNCRLYQEEPVVCDISTSRYETQRNITSKVGLHFHLTPIIQEMY